MKIKIDLESDALYFRISYAPSKRVRRQAVALLWIMIPAASGFKEG